MGDVIRCKPHLIPKGSAIWLVKEWLAAQWSYDTSLNTVQSQWLLHCLLICPSPCCFSCCFGSKSQLWPILPALGKDLQASASQLRPTTHANHGNQIQVFVKSKDVHVECIVPISVLVLVRCFILQTTRTKFLDQLHKFFIQVW